MANLRRNFATRLRLSRITERCGSIPSINSSIPNTYFGWLSVVPRVGFRGTYYDETRDLGNDDSHSELTATRLFLIFFCASEPWRSPCRSEATRFGR